MKVNKEILIVEIAIYTIKKSATVREASQRFGISKSSVHKYMVEDLPVISERLATLVSRVYENNKIHKKTRKCIINSMTTIKSAV